jgi:hypothetical protein
VVAVLGAFSWFLAGVGRDQSQHDAFGRADIPGSTVVHLPSGQVDVFYKEVLGVHDSFDLFSAPSVSLGVEAAANDGPNPPVEESHGTVSQVGNDDAHELVFRIDVPRETDYRITAGGDVKGRDSPQFLFGRAGRPWVPLAVGGGVVLVIWILSWLVLATTRRAYPHIG